ncbi:MAG: hypothetical protein ACYCYM_14720 [Saccharofermentanales bacterium]
MKKHISIAMCCLLLIAAVPGCRPFRHTENGKGILLHETPQTYVLTGDDAFMSMPTVTLYENGNARLSQPPISSLALFGTGHYEVIGDKLTVTHGENGYAIFAISDGGNTLTLKSSIIGFTKIGAVYRCRPNQEYLSGYNKVAGEKLTIQRLRELAIKAHALTVADFETYAHVDIDPDYHVFDVEGLYTLRVIFDVDGNTSCTIERNSSGDTFPIHLNGSTGLVFDEFLGIASVPEYETRKWMDYFGGDEMPWDTSTDLTLQEFPGITFTWTSEKVTANGKDLIWGMPVWNVYLADLTNDGKPEFCATVTLGSGICDTRVVVYDYRAGKEYQLADRMYYDYHLSMEDGKVMATQTEYSGSKPLVTSELRLVGGEIFRFGNTRP